MSPLGYRERHPTLACSLARRPLACKAVILGWSRGDELDPVHNDARSRQSLALDVTGPVRSLVDHFLLDLLVGSWAEPERRACC